MRAFAPGRVNLIGDHTDYMGGLVFPMALDRGITIEGTALPSEVVLTSDTQSDPARFSLPIEDPESIQPVWAKYVAGVAAELEATQGFAGHAVSNLPIAGLSSSAALQVATALALGYEGSALELALLCQRAEHRASGVPSGIMDPLTSAAGVENRALLIDCESLVVTPIELPDRAEFVVIHSGQHRELIDSAYAERRAQCEQAETVVGKLRYASVHALGAIESDAIRARARHVVTENQRVRDFVDALACDDLSGAGQLMIESHRSLARDFDVSTPVLNALVDNLTGMKGIYGARLTGAGFGGAVVVLADPASLDVGFVAVPSSGARLVGS